MPKQTSKEKSEDRHEFLINFVDPKKRNDDELRELIQTILTDINLASATKGRGEFETRPAILWKDK